MQPAGKQRFAKPYMVLLSVLGLCAVVLSLDALPFARIDLRFILLAAMTLTVGARISIKIPRVSGHISVSDTFIFLTIFLFGGERQAARPARWHGHLASHQQEDIDHDASTRNDGRFNLLALSLYSYFPATSLANRRALFAALHIAASIMASVQYVINSGTVAIAGALKFNEPFWDSWRKKYLWTSLTYITGASAAAVIAKLITVIGFYAFIGTLPFIGVVYFTYVTYMKNVEAAAAQAEQAERHVAELSHYITEQEPRHSLQNSKSYPRSRTRFGRRDDFTKRSPEFTVRALMLRTRRPDKLSRGLQIIIKTAEEGAETVKRTSRLRTQRRDHDFEPCRLIKSCSRWARDGRAERSRRSDTILSV